MHQALSYLSVTPLLTLDGFNCNPDDLDQLRISVECNRAKWFTDVALFSHTSFTVVTLNQIEIESEDASIEMVEVKRKQWMLPFSDGSEIKEVKVAAESELIYALN